jgi:hypothetical protein
MFILALVFAVVMVTIFLICFILIMPMVSVPVIFVTPDKFLAIRSMSPVFSIFCPVYIIMQIRTRVIQNYFTAMIKIEIWVSRRKIIGKCPTTSSQVNKLMSRNKIITLDIRDIIIIHVIISDGSPGRLIVNIDAEGYLCRYPV